MNISSPVSNPDPNRVSNPATASSSDILRQIDEVRAGISFYRALLEVPGQDDAGNLLSPLQEQAQGLLNLLTPAERQDFVRRFYDLLEKKVAQLSPANQDKLLSRPSPDTSLENQEQERLLSGGSWQAVDQEAAQGLQRGLLVKEPRLDDEGKQAGYLYRFSPLPAPAQENLAQLKTQPGETSEETAKRVLNFIGKELNEAGEFGVFGGALYLGGKAAGTAIRRTLVQAIQVCSWMRGGTHPDKKGIAPQLDSVANLVNPIEAVLDCSQSLIKNTVETGRTVTPLLAEPLTHGLDSALPRSGRGILEQQIGAAREVQKHLLLCLSPEVTDPFEKAKVFQKAHQGWEDLQLLSARCLGAYQGLGKEAVPGACCQFRDLPVMHKLGGSLDKTRELLRGGQERFTAKEIQGLESLPMELDQFHKEVEREAMAQKLGFPGLSKVDSIEMLQRKSSVRRPVLTRESLQRENVLSTPAARLRRNQNQATSRLDYQPTR